MTYIPYVEDLILEHQRRGTLNAEDLIDSWSRWGGRDGGPESVDRAASAGCLDAANLARALAVAWSGAARPEQDLPRRRWLTLWRRAGYASDGERVDPPEVPLTLYRGAPEFYARGLSWTADPQIALWFAQRAANYFKEPISVYVAKFPPSRLLGRIHTLGRGEDEYVAQPWRLPLDVPAVCTPSHAFAAQPRR